jgi:hypothetical protein
MTLFGSWVQAGEDLSALYRDGTPILDLRYRFEFVDQDDRAKDAKAHTLRTRAGFETGKVYGLGAGFDVEWIEGLGNEDYNDTLNGKTQYPVVADPDDFAINRLFLETDGTIPHAKAKLGRQRIIWDNHRFIGNVGFRQNEQTFDALRVSTTALPESTIEYVYLKQVNRIFGSDSDVGELDMGSHGLRGQFRAIQDLTITPFALILDYDRLSQAGNSSYSLGGHLDWNHELDEDWTLGARGGLVHQQDYGENPGDFDLWYHVLEPRASYGPVTARLGYEVLQGDGTAAFQTPLATLHIFNGLADQFLTTPADGLEDLYLTADLKVPGDGWLSDLTIKGGYHQFWAENTGDHYGWEWDLGAFKTIRTDYGSVLLGLQYADYHADDFASDTQKLWLTLQFKLSPEPYRDLVAGLESRSVR